MTKNKKKLRRAERRCVYTRATQTLVLTGLLLAGGVGAASAATQSLWGDLTVDSANPINIGANDVTGVWRDFAKLPNGGNLTIANGGSVTINGTGLGVVGDGNLLVQSGGTLTIDATGIAQISQGSLTLADGANLTMQGVLFLFGDITASGTLATNVISGMGVMTKGNLNWGANDFAAQGTSVAVGGNLVANSVNFTGAKLTVNGDLTATGAASTFNGTGSGVNAATVQGNARFGDLAVGNSTQGELTVNGSLNAGTVTINSKAPSTTGPLTYYGLTLGTATASGVHSAERFNIQQGGLILSGTKDTLGQTVATKEGIHFTAAAANAANAVLKVDGSSTITGGVYVEAGKGGKINMAAKASLHLDTLSVSGAGALLHVKGSSYIPDQGIVQADNFILQDGGEIRLNSGGSLKLSAAQVDSIGVGSKVTLESMGRLRVAGDWTYTAGATSNTVAFDTSSQWGTGVISVGGALTLKPGSGASSLTINGGQSVNASTSVINGNLLATTLKTEGVSEISVKAGSLLLTGNGGKMYTAADGSSTNITLNGGTLTLGADENTVFPNSDGIYGGTLDQVTFGSNNPVTSSADAAGLRFLHGNVTVGKFIDAATNGSILLIDSISSSMNTLTLGDANGNVDKAFAVKKAVFQNGNFTVNGEHGLAVLGEARIGNSSDDFLPFSINKLTLQGAAAHLNDASNNDKNGIFTIGELVLTDAGNKVTIKDRKVITKTLNLGDTAVTSGNLQVQGGVWQINDITKGTGSADFTLTGGTLLLGQDAKVGFAGGKNVFSLGSSTDQYGVLGTKNGTLGSTGTMTLVTDNNAFTVGAVTAAAGAMVNSVSGKIIKLEGGDATNTLNITNWAMVTAVGDGTKFFENTAAINVGFGSGGGTLQLGGMSADGTAAGGGSFGGVITLGSGANYGALAVGGGNVALSKVLIHSANVAGINFEGKGVLDIQTSNDGVTYAQGITLNRGNHLVSIGASADADYTVKGGIKVTKGTVAMGKSDGTNRLTGGVVLQGAADGDALFVVSGGANTVDSLTIAEGKSGTVNFSSSVKGSLTVNGDIDLHRGALRIGSSAMSTLSTTGTMVLGTITDAAPADAAGNTYVTKNSTLAANGLTVQDAGGNSAGIVLASDKNLTLAMGAGGVTADTFVISNGATVNLQGAGGKIALGANNALSVGGGQASLNVGLQGNTDVAAPVTPVESHWSTDKLALSNDGRLGLVNGSFSVADLTTSNSSGIGGTIAVGADAKGTASEAFGALRVKNATFDAESALAVSRGYAQFGSESAALDGAVRTAMTAGNAKAALVVTGKQFNLANTNLTSSFGQTRQRNSGTHDFGAVAAGDMEFGVDSLAFFDLGTVGQTDYAIKTVGNVYIDAGAQIAVHKDGGIKSGDSLKILETQADGIKGSWLASNASTSSRLLTLSMVVNADHSKMDGTVGMGNLAQTMPGLSSSMGAYLGTMVRTLGVDPNSANAGVRFVSRAADYGYLPDSNRVAPTIEGAAQTAITGATPGMTLAAVNAASNAVTMRTTFASPLMDKTKAVAVHMDENGVSLDEGLSAGDGLKNGLGLWMMPLYQSENVWGMKSGSFKTGYNGDLGGVAVGADYTFADAFRVGLALNLGGGYAQSSGDFNKTDNNFNFWGVNLYGGWTQNNFGITADVGYSNNYNKLTQELPSTMQMGGDLKFDVTSYAITSGLRGEYKFETDIVDIIPHISARYTSLNVNEYDVKRGGTVFSVDETNQSIWTFPVGVTFSKDVDMNNGWIFRPQVDLSVIPATGDVKAKSTSHMPGVPGSAELKTQVVDNMTYQGGLGFDIKNDNMAFGINYNIQASEHRTAHGVFGTFRYEF